MLSAGHLDVSNFATHRFDLQETQEAYEVFERPADTGALHVTPTAR
ncbi:alcohol dehydrogenase [Streptomyces indicus]|uniref:Alcohol dehydrogenase n=1 Tax=Streptomyces indicus TaxID=417292 RepID=A0A1G8ZV37_9ACTN|nr:alcohol dehydrogenase [Streptomyces indicus]